MATVVFLIENSLGSRLIGIFLNTYLYGLVTHQYFSYFTAKFGDPFWIRGLVLALFTLDTVHTSALIYMAWFYLIENYANYLALLIPLWPYYMTIFVTTCTAFLTHMLLIYRVLRLTNIYVYVILFSLSLASFGTGLACGVKSWVSVRNAAEREAFSPILATWLCSELVVDALITGTLLYALSRSRTGFHNSDTIINRLMRTSIQTGLFSGVFSILALSFYLGRPDTEFFAIFGFPISRLYTNTLMDTLLCREELRGLLHENFTGSTSGHFANRSVQMSVRKEVHTDIRFDCTESTSPTHKPVSNIERSSLDLNDPEFQVKLGYSSQQQH